MLPMVSLVLFISSDAPIPNKILSAESNAFRKCVMVPGQAAITCRCAYVSSSRWPSNRAVRLKYCTTRPGSNSQWWHHWRGCGSYHKSTNLQPNASLHRATACSERESEERFRRGCRRDPLCIGLRCARRKVPPHNLEPCGGIGTSDPPTRGPKQPKPTSPT